MKKTDVLVAGELNVDLILSGMTQFPQMEKEIMADNMLLTLGSSSAIFASNLSTLGTEVAFAGMISNDAFGKKVLESLKEKNVAVDAITISEIYKTGITVAMLYGSERAMVTHAGAMEHFGNENISDTLLQSAKHLHISSVFLQPLLKKDLQNILRRAKALHLTTSLDPQWDPAEQWDINLNEIFPMLDVFLPNASEWAAFTKNNDIEKSLVEFQKYQTAIVVKDGARGAYCLKDKNILFQPAFLCDTYHDAIGAGDSFDAGFIHAWLQNKNPQECLRTACLTGALNTTASGGTGAFQLKEKIQASIKKYFNTEI